MATLEDVLTVKAPAASPAAQAPASAAVRAQPAAGALPSRVELVGGGEVPEEIVVRGNAIVKALLKTLNDGRQARLAESEVSTQAVSAGAGSIYSWDIATAGPYNLDIPAENTPTLFPNQVIPAGNFALMIGISYAADSITRSYLAAKAWDARFTVINLSKCSSGIPVGSAFSSPTFKSGIGVTSPFSPTSVFTPLTTFQLFLWYFKAELNPGTDQELYQVNFTIDITPNGDLLGAGFSEYNWDPYPSLEIPPTGLGSTSAHWQAQSSARFLVND